jgi:hypothetical protein
MSVKKLDRDRYAAIVYGDEAENPDNPAKFLQDGIFFNGMGIAINSSAPPPAKPVATNEPVEVVELKDPEQAETLKMLNGKTVPALKKLAEVVNENTGVELPAFGTGVKARLVKYIADNTE